MNFPQIDTSYWLTEDPEWVAARKEHWLKIEPMLLGQGQKSKKAITIIKRYFLQGAMPGFEKLKSWKSYERHLDIFCFIWLHPSWDEALLTQLRDAYVSSSLIVENDIIFGLGTFLDSGKIMASQNYTLAEMKDLMHTDGHNELLYEVLMGDLAIAHIPEFHEQICDKPKERITSIFTMTKWLCDEAANSMMEDCLYQYQQVLEWWYLHCPVEEEFFEKFKYKKKIPVCKKALYRIHHFDIEKEGDTCRTHFVTKMRKMLNERDFIPAFKQMWLDVKAGKIEVENPWER
jgi:hypothetical protein